MSRPIYEITLTLTDGTVLRGRGRNLPATVERAYKAAQGPLPARPLLMSRISLEETGYVGTYRLFFGNAHQASKVPDGTVDVVAAGSL